MNPSIGGYNFNSFGLAVLKTGPHASSHRETKKSKRMYVRPLPPDAVGQLLDFGVADRDVGRRKRRVRPGQAQGPLVLPQLLKFLKLTLKCFKP
jgi:hypothetical protein